VDNSLESADTDILTDLSEKLYAARRDFLRANFESYVADTYYYTFDDGYYCWPSQTNGYFEGFTDLTDAERQLIETTSETIELVGVGASRIVCRFPTRFERAVVVKFGRCGMGESYGTGRVDNLIEYQLSTSTDTLPIVPSLYCDPVGRYAIYPEADTIAEREVSDSRRTELKSKMEAVGPEFRETELDTAENLGRWNGEIRILDYCAFETGSYPMGVPDHVDTDAVIRAVDDRRRDGTKLDIESPGTLISPRLR